MWSMKEIWLDRHPDRLFAQQQNWALANLSVSQVDADTWVETVMLFIYISMLVQQSLHCTSCSFIFFQPAAMLFIL